MYSKDEEEFYHIIHIWTNVYGIVDKEYRIQSSPVGWQTFSVFKLKKFARRWIKLVYLIRKSL